MSELPTAAAPSTTPDVTRALASIEAAKLTAGTDVVECLDAIGDLIRITGAPDAILDWVTHLLQRETLRQYAAQQHVTLHESRATEDQPSRAFIIWTVGGQGMGIVPEGQDPALSLLQLREEIAQHAEDQRQSRAFQASVAAGHVEAIDAWHARTSKASR
ncbi:hypothetical protein [Streptomyces alfalfae]